MALSKEKLEILKCMSSPMHWIDNYGMCFNSETQKVELMKCYDYQREAIRNFENFQNNIVLKSRQCLLKGSLIETINGKVEIEKLKHGDIIYSYNKEKKIIEEDIVVESWRSGIVNCYKVILNNGKEIESGEYHPFFVIDKFILAKNLKKGDKLLSFTGEDIFVEEVIETGEKECFDISVKNNENYFFEEILVHNTGFSVITAAYVAWTIMFKSEQRVLILANDLISSVRLLKTVKEFIDNTPKFLLPSSIITNNQKYIEFSNGSWAKAVACSPNAGRGEALTLLVIDEAAFIENDDDIKAGALMAVSKTVGGKTLMISTPKGTSNLYYKTWSSAIKKENNYQRLIAHWTQNPTCIKGLETRKDQETGAEYQWSPWYQEQCERLGHDKVKIAQELDLAFDSSKYLAVDASIIAIYRQYVQKMRPLCYFDYTQYELENDCFTDEKNSFFIWEKPDKEKKYIIGADVSRGDGKDYSTIQILDAENLIQVAEYQGKIASDKFAEVILAAAVAYNNAFVVIEVNNMGLTTAYYLHKTLGYKNVYKSKSIMEVWTGPRDAKWSVQEGDEIPGFQTTSKTRPFLITSLKKYMKERQVRIKSQRLIAEFDTFVVKENGKAEHERGANDDLIIAFAIALFIRDTQWEQVAKSKSLYEAMKGAFIHSSTPAVGLPSKNEEMIKKINEKQIEKINGTGMIFNIGNEVSETKKEDEDTSWLFD